MGEERRRWGTWEELILGGAVLRHGTRDWAVVSSELQARTLFPYTFTPEACKAKYKDLQQRYSGCRAWVEELRKKRVAELRRELEISEGSIGSLESKLENLKANKEEYNQVDYCCSHTESPVPLLKSEGVESSGKETSKDGLSAGSFTQEARANWSPGTTMVAELETKPEVSVSCEKDIVSSTKKPTEVGNEQGGTLRKRRGKRKRKNCNVDPKEGSIGESKNMGSTEVAAASQCDGNSASDCGQTVRSALLNDQNRTSSGVRNNDLMSIFNSIAKTDNALVFRHRLDIQKRARYKKIIRRHVDFDTIRSRISNCSIISAKELFRDMLLLANNALVFYSKRTREYKSALLLRDLVSKEYRKQCKDFGNKPSSAMLSMSQMCSPPVRPRSFRPFKHKFPVKVVKAVDDDVKTSQGCKKQSNADSSPSVESSMLPKKGFGRAGRVGRRMAKQQQKTPTKERRKAQRR